MPTPVHILLVEDSEDDALLILRAVRNGGYAPTYARVVSEAELHAQLIDPTWDIVISDFNLGSFDGLAALRIVKKQNDDVPFILVSGTVGEDVAVTAMRAGAQDYIMKGNLVRLAPAIARELNERKRRKENREQLAIKDEEVRQAQKMEIMGQIAGGLAHDFNNILGVVSLYTEKIAAEVFDPALKECVKGIAEAHQRGSKLVRQLMTIGRKQAATKGKFDLNRVIENLKPMMSVGLGRRNELVLDFGREETPIMGDSNQIEQVIMNLVLNARDAIEEAGKVTVQTKIENDGDVKKVVLIVSDTGCGMDQATMNRIFEPFFTTKEVGKGTGIGLATVYAIIKQHQGNISVASQPGRGATFKIQIPLAQEEK